MDNLSLLYSFPQLCLLHHPGKVCVWHDLSASHDCKLQVCFAHHCKHTSDCSCWNMLRFSSLPVVSDSLWPQGLQHARPPCPSPSPEVCPSSCPLHQWCRLAISSFDTLFSFCPQSFPASGIFPMSRLFTSNDQNTGASPSASVFPSIQGWFALRLTGLISLLSMGLSGIFSSTTVQRHQFFGTMPSLWSSSHNRTWPLGRP